MKLIVVDSGSSGNCHLLQCNDEVLILDAGCSFMRVKKALGFNVRQIVGVIVTHEHG